MRKRSLLVLVLALGLLAVTAIFLFEETRQLTGVVRDAETNAPISEAAVALATQVSVSDAQGEYSLAMPRGTDVITVTADGYASGKTSVNGDELFKHSFSLDLLLSPNRVTGVVRDAENKQPLPNVPVRVGDKTVVANELGVFEAKGVKKGVTVTAQAPGYEPKIGLYAGEGDVALDLTPTVVTVTVVDKYTNKPVAQAKVQQGDASAITDANGRALVYRVKPGVPITATAAGFATGSVDFTASPQVALRPNTLDGTVVDASTSKPISGTLVYLGDTIAQTGANGQYHLDNVPEKAAIILKAPGYSKTQVDASGTIKRDVKLEPFAAEGIHIPFGLPADQVRELLDMVDQTELNAIVIDVKGEKGRLAWDSQVPLAKEIGAPLVRGIDLHEVVSRCKTQNIYCIARLAVFQDDRLAFARPDLAIQHDDGSVYIDNGGASWVNPYKTEVWDYDIALAKEIAALGFDEVQFDYIRFPGEIAGVNLGSDNTEESRVAAIAGFLAKAQKEMRPTGVYLSADVFGLTTATNDDQGTGQRLHDLGPYLDYVSPMVYPDVWVGASYLVSKGLGILDCTEALLCPYEVIYNSYKRAAEKTTTKVRLWLQAYAGPADYGVKEFRLQRKAAIDAGSVGWMFWNNTGTYDVKTFDPPSK
jgi:hypothetical protein